MENKQFVKIPMAMFKTGMMRNLNMAKVMLYYTLKSFVFRDENQKEVTYKPAKGMYKLGFLAAEVSQEKLSYCTGLKRQTIIKYLQEMDSDKWLQKKYIDKRQGTFTYILGFWSMDQNSNKTEYFYFDEYADKVTNLVKKAITEYKAQVQATNEDVLDFQKQILQTLNSTENQQTMLQKEQDLHPYSEKEFLDSFQKKQFISSFLSKNAELQSESSIGTSSCSPKVTQNRNNINRDQLNKNKIKDLRSELKPINEEYKKEENLELIKTNLKKEKNCAKKERKVEDCAHMCTTEIEEDLLKKYAEYDDINTPELRTLDMFADDCTHVQEPIQIKENELKVQDPVAESLEISYSEAVKIEHSSLELVEVEMPRKKKDEQTLALLAPKQEEPKKPKVNKYAAIYDAYHKQMKDYFPDITIGTWTGREWGQLNTLVKRYGENGANIVENYIKYVIHNWQDLKKKYKIEAIAPTVGLLCSGFQSQWVPESQRVNMTEILLNKQEICTHVQEEIAPTEGLFQWNG